MSKIFGELLMLIDKDYSGTKATLAYSGMPFYLPENLYIIGMMNTADRSLAMIDYALRRRFSFFDIEPGFNSDGFVKYQESFANDTFDALISQIKQEHHTYLSEINAAQVKWDIIGDTGASLVRFLPVMQTDITLRLGDIILIIDAKYYGKSLQKQYDKYTIHSGNMYQIYSYVKNQDKKLTGNVGGLLLYAKTDEEIAPDGMANIGGNLIGAKTLDLNVPFRIIAKQLDKIAYDFFGIIPKNQ